MRKQTPIYDRHVAAGARIVDFGGWDMPLHYGSQLDEHHAVRRAAGLFDVSHMAVVDVDGTQARPFLRYALANDVDKLTAPGRALYSCMLNHQGGIIDDLIVYRTTETAWVLVVNAARRGPDLEWLHALAQSYEVRIRERDHAIMLAVQGPQARTMVAPLLPAGIRDAALALEHFECCSGSSLLIARTGYTGEDGWEIVTEPGHGQALWDAACEAGVVACGLGARDTLRLEAGLSLYGQDMDERTSPLISNLAWTVAWEPADRDFVGRAALQAERANGATRRLAGLLLEDRGIMRSGQAVETEHGEGRITSGGFSPTMQRSIALARIPAAAVESCAVVIRGDRRRARIVRPPFVRNGQVLIEDQQE